MATVVTKSTGVSVGPSVSTKTNAVDRNGKLLVVGAKVHLIGVVTALANGLVTVQLDDAFANKSSQLSSIQVEDHQVSLQQ